jgi:hypothetical protein
MRLSTAFVFVFVLFGCKLRTRLAICVWEVSQLCTWKSCWNYIDLLAGHEYSEGLEALIYEKINSRFAVDFLPNRDQQKNNLIYERNSRRSRSQSPRFKFKSGVFDSSMENATLNSTR